MGRELAHSSWCLQRYFLHSEIFGMMQDSRGMTVSWGNKMSSELLSHFMTSSSLVYSGYGSVHQLPVLNPDSYVRHRCSGLGPGSFK